MSLLKTCIVILSFLLFSCHKPSEETLKLWVGLWTANENTRIFFIDIQQNGTASYEEVGVELVNGTLKIDDKKNILSIKNKDFTITSYPAINSSLNKYQTTLNGLVYTKN